MPPIKRKKCCVPYCRNIQEISNKQFFKIGANLESREKWLSRVGKAVAAKSQLLYCCEDHFDIPNDAENYIKFKYVPGTKLKLRPCVLPQKKLPLNVCRLCLKLIYNGDDFIDISEKKGAKNAQIIAATLPEIDLSLTVEPVVCLKCFEPLERFYKIKEKALNSEVIVVNCIKSIVKKSPTRLIKNCEIDLFDEYNDIMEFLEAETGEPKATELIKVIQDQPEVIQDQNLEKSTEEIVIQIEESMEDKYNVEQKEDSFFESSDQLRTLLEDKTDLAKHNLNQENSTLVESLPYTSVVKVDSSEIKVSPQKRHFSLQNVSLKNISECVVESTGNLQYGEGLHESSNVHIDSEQSETVVIVTPHL